MIRYKLRCFNFMPHIKLETVQEARAKWRKEKQLAKNARKGMLGIYAVGRLKRMPGSFDGGKKRKRK